MTTYDSTAQAYLKMQADVLNSTEGKQTEVISEAYTTMVDKAIQDTLEEPIVEEVTEPTEKNQHLKQFSYNETLAEAYVKMVSK